MPADGCTESFRGSRILPGREVMGPSRLVGRMRKRLVTTTLARNNITRRFLLAMNSFSSWWLTKSNSTNGIYDRKGWRRLRGLYDFLCFVFCGSSLQVGGEHAAF